MDKKFAMQVLNAAGVLYKEEKLARYDLVNACIQYINECLNPEPDSIEKIIEEFRKLNWKVDTFKFKGKNKFIHLIDENENKYMTIYENCYFKINTLFDVPEIYSDELSLINRVFRLWGVEV